MLRLPACAVLLFCAGSVLGAGKADSAGDALPKGAVARLGTNRLQHAYAVHAFAFTPDGKVLASVGGDRRVRLWAVPSGALRCEVPVPNTPQTALAFTPDGKRLATHAADAIRFWDLEGRPEAVWKAPYPVKALSFSRDGKILAALSASEKSTIHVWNAVKGVEIRDFTVGPGEVSSFALSPDANTLALCGYHRGLEVWEVESGTRLHRLTGTPGFPLSVAFSPDGKTLLAGTTAGVQVRSIATGRALRTFGKPGGWPEAISISEDGKLAAVPEADGSVSLFDPGTGKEVRSCTGAHDRTAVRVALSADGKFLASSASLGSQIVLWDARTGKPLLDRPGHRAGVNHLAVSPDGKWLASGGLDRVLRLWDLAAGKEVRRIPFGYLPVGGISFAPDSKTLAAGGCSNSPDNVARLWDVQTGKELKTFGKPRSGIQAVAFSPDGNRLLTGGGDVLEVYDVATGKLIRQHHAGAGWVGGACFLPDGKGVASAHGNGRLAVWDEKGTVSQIGVHSVSAFALAFTPDGKTVVVGTADSAGHIWDVAGRRELGRLEGHEGHVFAVAVSPDGRRIATAGLSGKVHLWETLTGGKLGEFTGHMAAVKALVFTPDGKRLLSASEDSSILVWDARQMLGRTALVARALSGEELERLWQDLSDSDAGKANRAVGLLSAGKGSLAFIEKELVGGAKPDRIERWIRELDDEKFAIRERASAGLAGAGATARPRLLKALETTASAEVRRRVKALLARTTDPHSALTEDYRPVRAVEVLEEMASRESQALLERLVKEFPTGRLGEEARRALGRLRGR